MTLTQTEKSALDELEIQEDRDPSIMWAYICQTICKKQGVPFNEASEIAKQKFPSLYTQLPCAQPASAPGGAATTSPLPNATATNGGAYSVLLGCDPARVTPAAAKIAFNKEVKRLQDDEGRSFEQAWKMASDAYPEVLKRMVDKTSKEPAAAAIPNALTGFNDAPLAAKPFNLPALGLPMNASNEEYQIAWTANGRQTHTRNSEAILTALIAWIMKKYGRDITWAKNQAQAAYPELWKVAGDKPIPPRLLQ